MNPYNTQPAQQLEQLDQLLDQVDELIMSLPIRADKRKLISSRVYAIYAEAEAELEVMSSDWEP
jgi:phosphoglycerate dehydrogenase-like enzyme